MNRDHPHTQTSDHRSVTVKAAAKAAAAILLALALTVPAQVTADTKGGGIVTNTLPTVTSFTAGAAEVNRGAPIVFSGVVFDRNKEKDIVEIKVMSMTAPEDGAFSATVTVAPGHVAVGGAPAEFDVGGWKVWNAVGNDGLLAFQLEATLLIAGDYTFAAAVRDENGFQTGPAGTVAVTVVEKITVSPDPVKWDGSPEIEGTRWGGWAVLPGAVNVTATNYLKITNTGTTPDQGLVFDFTQIVLTGATDGTETIAIDGNIQYSCWEDTTPLVSAPMEGEGQYTWSATSATGSIALSFTGLDNILYCTYRLVALQEILGDQAYEASYTATAL